MATRGTFALGASGMIWAGETDFDDIVTGNGSLTVDSGSAGDAPVINRATDTKGSFGPTAREPRGQQEHIV